MPYTKEVQFTFTIKGFLDVNTIIDDPDELKEYILANHEIPDLYECSNSETFTIDAVRSKVPTIDNKYFLLDNLNMLIIYYTTSSGQHERLIVDNSTIIGQAFNVNMSAAELIRKCEHVLFQRLGHDLTVTKIEV